MKKFEVSVTYIMNEAKNTDKFKVDANGKDKAIKVALKSFDAKHKKDNIYMVETSIKQIISEEEDLI